MTNIVKVGFVNGLSKTKGCESSPSEILNILREEIFSNENEKEIKFDCLNIGNIKVDNGNVEDSNKKIYESSLEILKLEDKIVFLGGDHSISYSIGKAFLENCEKENKEPCLIVFDAHPDLMPVPKGNEKFPTHEEWLRGLIDIGFPVENILLVGVRNSDVAELEFMKENKIKRIFIDDLEEDIDNIADTIMEFTNGKETYLSLDIDVVDPAFAPATGYCETCGLTSRQFLYLVKRINKIKNLKCVDIVEINSEKDGKFDMRTTRLGAKILGEVI